MINPKDVDNLKTVCFIGDEEDATENDIFYYVIDEMEDSFYVVFAEKIDLFLNVQGTYKESFYGEMLSRDELTEIEI